MSPLSPEAAPMTAPKLAAPEVTALAYHRNGISGAGFHVAIVLDNDGSEKVVIRFGAEADKGTGGVVCAVLDLGILREAEGGQRIAFARNSWRGDHYNGIVDRAIAQADANDTTLFAWKDGLRNIAIPAEPVV